MTEMTVVTPRIMDEFGDAGGEYYLSSMQHILAELECIDLLIQVSIWRARQLQQVDPEFQGLYISEEEVDLLLSRPAGLPHWAASSMVSSLPDVRPALQHLKTGIQRRKAGSGMRSISLRLDMLARLFQLEPLDIDILLVCLGPELDLRYELLYAYLQDDVTKKRPSVDLALNLLSSSYEAKLANRRRFLPDSPLVKHRLLSLSRDPSETKPPLLAQYLKVDERVVNYLLELDALDASISPFTRQVAPKRRLEDLSLADEVKQRLGLLVRDEEAQATGLVLYFQGPYGVGKADAAEAVARETGQGLLVVDLERLLELGKEEFEVAVRLVNREALLQETVIYWKTFDELLQNGREPRLLFFRELLEERHGLTVLAGDTVWEPSPALAKTSFVRIKLSLPAYAERLRLWTQSLNGARPDSQSSELQTIANKFRFSGGQIADAAATARDLARWRDPEYGRVTGADLYTACRLQSNRKLAELAQKIRPHYVWDDIILPLDRLQQLQEIRRTVAYRALVYDEWGFDNKLSLGKGLNALFAGPSGTGKTMAAEIIAGELGLDLYKIDLSTVVSKYVGETEKNLSRIFFEAETSNAILFFDEADALFGRRSEVRDAHDRYANIEVSYLLQQMEEYQGVAILATNLRKNMDAAFVRRMHFIIEFPFPAESYRRQIWEKIWPEQTPRDKDIDLDYMAKKYEMAGGNIRNVALAASFLAASDGGVVNMKHIKHATRREYQKMGKMI